MALELPKRFSDKVNFTDTCWLWTAAKNIGGYGLYRNKNKNTVAHRYAWEYFNGEIPAGMKACHKCDVPSCVNPDHIFIGTTLDNIADRVAKDRGSRGENHKFSKLSQSQADEIRNIYKRGDGNNKSPGKYSLKGLAEIYGVHFMQIRRIVKNESYKSGGKPT